MQPATMPTVKVFRKAWDDQAARLLGGILSPAGVQARRAAVQANEIGLYEVQANEFSIGIFLVRLVHRMTGEKELVILHGAAEHAIKTPLTSILGPHFDYIARSCGAKYVRVHSQRRGLDAVLQEHGYEFMETVFVKELA